MRELELFTLCHPIYSIEGVEYHDNFKYEETLDYYFDNYPKSLLGSKLKLKNLKTSLSKSKSIMTEYIGLGGLVFHDKLYDVINKANTLDSVIIECNLLTKKVKEQAGFLFLYEEVAENFVNYREIIFNVLDFKNNKKIDQIGIGSFSEYYNIITKLRREGKYLKFSSFILKGDIDIIIKLDVLRFKLGGSHLFSRRIVEKIKEEVSDVKFERTGVKYFY